MYPFLQKDHEVFERWTPIAAGLRPPTEDENKLMAAVKQALEAGLYYETAVQKHVKEHADFIPPEAWQIRGATEGGVMGYECYHARRAMDAFAERAENEEAVKAYCVGQKIGTLYINGKRTNALNITSIEGTTVIMLGKSGSSTVQVTIAARAIKTAKERAIARGWRKAQP
ncbi:MAG: hypothetical protein EHM33_02080 [Chloroflexi bacterium]|nr:MAG: hypothetical protein EHM33_02080 [Chloroflexota bacterium]